MFESEVQIKLIMERLINLLKENEEIKDYRIIINDRESYQLFFVQDKLETNRATDSTAYHVTVYVDVDDKRGSGSFDYAVYLSDEEVKKLINEAIYNAKLALNPYFPLPNPTGDKPIALKSNISKMSLADAAEKVAKAIFKANMSENCYSSATEIFVYHNKTRIVNSCGLDNCDEKYYGEVELIPTYETENKEVEIYHMIRFMELDEVAITEEVNEVLELVKARYYAEQVPENLKCPVIIDGYEVEDVFGSYFAEDLLYNCEYTKTNLFSVGQDIQENGAGDKITMKAVPYYKGAYRSRGIDGDGIVLQETSLIENGVIKSRYGDNQYGYYLKQKATGTLPILIVEPGKNSIDEVKKNPYLRCVRFSSIQIDRMNGLIGGEVRLAFYFDGREEIPVTGFTISGNMHDLKGKIILSKETTTYAGYHGPKYVCFPDMKIF